MEQNAGDKKYFYELMYRRLVPVNGINILNLECYPEIQTLDKSMEDFIKENGMIHRIKGSNICMMPIENGGHIEFTYKEISESKAIRLIHEDCTYECNM